MPDSKRPALAGVPVGRRTFSTAFRGFDQEEVKAYLEALAHEFRDLRERIAELEGQLEAEKDRPAVADPPKVDVASITTALGEETARVLRTAQEAADDMRSRAEEGAARTLKEAHEEAVRVRAAAESILAERTTEAEAAATAIRREADEETTKLRREATSEAEATVAKAVEQGRDMLSQAQAARERVLSDLARRRKVALNQLDALRAGRERLHTRFLAARGELEHIMEDLARSDEEARLAEEAVGHVPARADAAADEPDAPDVDAAKHDGPSAPVDDVADAPEAQDAPVATVANAEEVGAAEAGAAAPVANDAGAPVGEEPTPGSDPVVAADIPPDVAADAGGVVAEDRAAADTAPAATAAGEVAAPPIDGGPRGDKAAAGRPTTRTRYRHDPVPPGVLPSDAVGTAVVDEAAGGRVDELFAKIRADRAHKVEEARAVLAGDVGAGGVAAGDAGTGDATAGGGAGDVVTAAAAAAGGAAGDATAGAAEVGTDDPGLEAPRSDQDESYLQRRDAALDKPLASTLRAVKRGLADDQNAALERLRTARPGKLSVDALLGEETAHVERVAGWAAAGLAACAKAGSRLVGGAETAVRAQTLAPIAGRMAEGLAGPVRRRLAELIDGAADDRGPDTVDRINSMYREARARIDRLVGDAATEAVSAAIAAALAPGTPVRWVVEDVDGPCPDCDDNALGGALPIGQPFPTGQLAPPAHPGCRCVLAPTPT